MDINVKMRKGQAFLELTIGLFALVLVIVAALGFQDYILTSLEIHRTMRARVGGAALGAIGDSQSYISATESDAIEVEPIAATYIFGKAQIKLQEEIHMPAMGGINL